MRRTALLLLLTLALCLTGCAQNAVKPAPGMDEPTSVQIGLSMDSFVIERWQRDRDVFVSHAKELGMEVLVQDAGGDVNEQIEQIRYFIRKRVRAVVVVAVDCNALTAVIKEARDAGVVVISYDRLIQNAPVDLYVSFDNEKVGRLMAENLIANVPAGGRIVCINGSETDNNVHDLRRGFLDEINRSTLRIVYTEYCHNWEAQDAYDYMQQVLGEGIAFEAVMCGNDDLASMVYKALSERALIDDVVLVGQDADLSACQRIAAGWQSMTVHKQVETLARRAAECVHTLLGGGEVAPTGFINNGYADVPSILLEPVAVTRENIDAVIVDGGFHTRDDVYTNVRSEE